jgi:repressor LexA
MCMKTSASAKTLNKSLKTKSKKTEAPVSLTEKERAVLNYVEQSLLERGLSPSFQEIKDHFGFASFNSVQNYLKQLSQKGYISIPSNQKRAIQVIRSGDAVQKQAQMLQVQAQEQAKKQSPAAAAKAVPAAKVAAFPLPAQSNRFAEEVLSLPLLGKVAAGRPFEEVTSDETVDVPPSMVRNASKTFALKVSGNSMIDDGIHDGDIILVQKQSNASNGEIVVATIDNESTVKRFFLRPNPEQKAAANQKMVELRPANSTMSSMWYDPEQVDIRGVLVGLLRKF